MFDMFAVNIMNCVPVAPWIGACPAPDMDSSILNMNVSDSWGHLKRDTLGWKCSKYIAETMNLPMYGVFSCHVFPHVRFLSNGWKRST